MYAKEQLEQFNGWYIPEGEVTLKRFLKPNFQHKFSDNKIFPIVESLLKDKKVVIDIGANIGYVARTYSEMFEQVHCFEPVSVNFSCLKYNTENKNNINYYNVGLSNEENQIKIYNYLNSNDKKWPGAAGGWSIVDFINPSWKGYSAKKIKNNLITETINVKTLDSFNLMPDFIKIDVQSYELQVLQGAVKTIKKYKPVIQTEHTMPEELKATSAFLQNFGYVLQMSRGKDHFFTAKDKV